MRISEDMTKGTNVQITRSAWDSRVTAPHALHALAQVTLTHQKPTRDPRDSNQTTSKKQSPTTQVSHDDEAKANRKPKVRPSSNTSLSLTLSLLLLEPASVVVPPVNQQAKAQLTELMTRTADDDDDLLLRKRDSREGDLLVQLVK